MPHNRSLDWAFFCLLLVIVLGSLRLWQGDFQLQSNLLALLPDEEGISGSRLASEQLSIHLGDDFVFFVAGTDTQQVIDATRRSGALIEASPHFQLISPLEKFGSRIRFIDALKQHRFHLLSQEQSTQLESGNSEALLKEAILAAYDLTATASVTTLAEDPLGLFNRYIMSLPGDSVAVNLHGEVVLLESQGTSYGLLHGHTRDGAFNLDVQSAMAVLETDLAQILNPQESQKGQLRLLRAGAIFHASRAANLAKHEVTVIGLGSALGILLLFIATFRSVWPLILSLSSIAFGCLFAFVFCWNLYGELHLLTLVFGASLIGVAVDYSLHYLTRSQASNAGLPGLGLALLTSIVGYGSLLEAHLPGIREMAVFSISGLVASGLFVLVIFPRAGYQMGQVRTGLLPAISRVPALLAQRLDSRALWGIIAIGVLVLTQVQITNNIRIFHTPDPALLREQARIESLLPTHAPNQFYLIQGKTPELVLRTAEAIKPELDTLVLSGSISGYALISDTLPSLQRQTATNQLLMSTVYRSKGEAEAFFASLGFNEDSQEIFRNSLEQAQPLSPATWFASAPVEQQIMWLGRQEGLHYSIVLLESVTDVSELKRAASNWAAVEFVDTVVSISKNLEARTRAAYQLLLLAYAAIGTVLLVRYRQLSALKLLLIPLSSSIMTAAFLTAMGTPLTLFHIFALYLILGLGMDYGIFLKESGADADSCLLAILVSVLTSALSFGLLALSSTPMIAAFGLTVMIGVMCNWLLVPLAGRR